VGPQPAADGRLSIVDLEEAVRRRQMVRSFAERQLPIGTVDGLLRAALRAPSAGNTRGTAWIVLEGQEATRHYWSATTTAEWRERSGRWSGLSRAPVVLLALTSPSTYVARYDESDKAASGLGSSSGGEEAWPVPYWWGDAAFGVMTVLLAAVAHGVGACFLGNFRGEAALLRELDVPEGWRLFGAVLLGYADPDIEDIRSRSLTRSAPTPKTQIHSGRW
jgi:nitroreductase